MIGGGWHQPRGHKLFRAVESQSFGPDICFLCGATIEGESSKEHVFPSWLLHRHDLWDSTVTLLNGTTIPYRQLTIPCCVDCNTRHLSQLERRVEVAFEAGAAGVAELNEYDLFLWISKILYGLLYKEGLLWRNRSNPEDGGIVERETLELFASHHYLLQGVRIPMRFTATLPASIFTFEAQVPTDPDHHFDFRDHPLSLSFALRAGDVAIVAALQDGGSQRDMFADYVQPFQGFAIHPLQFLEITSRTFYKSMLFNRAQRYVTVEEGDGLKVVTLPIAHVIADPPYDEWDQKTYAKILAHHVGLSVSDVYGEEFGTVTWLYDETEQPKFISLRDAPWPVPM